MSRPAPGTRGSIASRYRACVVLAAAVVATLVSAGTSASGRSASQLPNLVTLMSDVRIGQADGTCVSRVCLNQSPEPALRFASGFANRGDYAFEIFGEPDGPLDRKAMQCVAWSTERVCADRTEVGRLIFHAEHGHFHFKNFALYELRRFRANMTPDLSPKGLVVDGGKVSFCMIDGARESGSSPPNPLYASCASGLFMGLSPGYRDIYPAGTPGQYITLDGVDDGVYALVITLDPENLLKEQPASDNIAVTGIRLSNDGNNVKVICENRPGSMRCR